MKTDTREYNDGTEPDVYRRWCCDGLCKQGRLCPKLMPAEAATDIGQDPDFYSREMMLEELGKFVISFLVATTVVLTIAALVWYYVTTP
jgi:hypothetical protein